MNHRWLGCRVSYRSESAHCPVAAAPQLAHEGTKVAPLRARRGYLFVVLLGRDKGGTLWCSIEAATVNFQHVIDGD